MFVLFLWGDGGHVCVVGLFWRHWASVLDDFRVIWGAKMRLKSILRHLVGSMAPQRGFLRAQWCHFGRFGGHFGCILAAKIMPKSVPTKLYFSIISGGFNHLLELLRGLGLGRELDFLCHKGPNMNATPHQSELRAFWRFSSAFGGS